MSDYKNLSYQFRVYPNKKQEDQLTYSFIAAKKIWNELVTQEKRRREEGSLATPKEILILQAKRFVLREEYKDGDPLAYGAVGANLSRAIQRNEKAPDKCFFPGPKLIHSRTGTYHRTNEDSAIGYDVNGKLYLPFFGTMKIRGLRPLPYGARIISLAIHKKPSGRYIASIAFYLRVKAPEQLAFKPPMRSVGLDYSPARLFVSTDPNLQIHKEEVRANRGDMRRLKRIDAKISFCKGLSKNKMKQRKKAGIVEAKLANRRKDLIEKASTRIANNYDAVFIEDIDIEKISLRHDKYHLGWLTRQSAWGTFVKRLKQKCEQRNIPLIKVSRFYPSSQICSFCGYQIKNKLSLKERMFRCPKCGAEIDRDINAARNIQKEGLRLLSAQ